MSGSAFEKVKKLRTGKNIFTNYLKKNFFFEAEVIHVNFPRKGNVSTRFCSEKMYQKGFNPQPFTKDRVLTLVEAGGVCRGFVIQFLESKSYQWMYIT